jgi:methionyl-tRNA formyltransferase
MNKKSLPSLVFFGTPEFARYCLAYLLESKIPVLAVVTAPDKKAGRGKKLTSSAVKEFALSKGIRVLQPLNLKDSKFIEQLQEIHADAFAVVAFRMLPKAVWSLPRLGTINLHASLLPNYRGAAPINWVLINGETETGVTTFLIDEDIDSGAILMKQSLSISSNDTFKSLHDKLLEIGAPLLAETLIRLSENSIQPEEQHATQVHQKAPKLHSENTRLDWGNSLEQLVNQIRGLNPFPGAWTTLFNQGKEERIKIFEAEARFTPHSYPQGSVLAINSELLIATDRGYLICKEIQLPNKKRMTASDLLNGYSIGSKAYIA